MRGQIKEDYELNDVVGPDHVAVLQLRATGSAAGGGQGGRRALRARVGARGARGEVRKRCFCFYVFQSLRKQG